MREITIISIITLLLLLGGIISVQFSSTSIASSKFNFYKSEITINDTQITEKLYYQPDKSYHTLFRNFVDPVFESGYEYSVNSVLISSVLCSAGTPYFKTAYGECFQDNIRVNCLDYTENNEYGCTFGSQYGFFKNNQYTITSNYKINPENIFVINGNNYIKFVVYSPNNHYRLTKNDFLVFSEKYIVKKDIYSTNENVIIYIPYEKSTEGKQLFYRNEFEFDKTNKQNWTIYLISFIPAFIFFFSWLIFGRERIEENIPGELSMMPDEKNKRKPWQVAAYFNPPLSIFDKNSFSSTLLNFYHKKVIDIKLIDDDIYIKVNDSHKYPLDKIENDILNILKIVENKASDKYKKQGYVNLKKAPQDFFNFSLKSSLKAAGIALNKEIKKQGKEFVSTTGVGVASILMFISLYPMFFTGLIFMVPLMFLTIFGIVILNSRTALFSKHKKGFYTEYQHWQAFKKYLKYSFSIREGTHKTIAMWGDYLVYSTALGVSKRVIKELKANHIITEQQERLYLGTYSASVAFASSSGVSGGGHGGAGGGGVGGGGGGGR